MENTISRFSWVLVGIRPVSEEQISEETAQRMLAEAFLPGRTFTLFLCGAEIEKQGTLEEMEEGLTILMDGMKDYNVGDYCIISKHEEGNLLFMPLEPEEENAQEISGDTNPS